MIATAKLRYLGVSAQKTRLVVDTVRGKNVGDALSLLHFSPKLVARDLEKLMKSAVTNAGDAIGALLAQRSADPSRVRSVGLIAERRLL